MTDAVSPLRPGDGVSIQRYLGWVPGTISRVGRRGEAFTFRYDDVVVDAGSTRERFVERPNRAEDLAVRQPDGVFRVTRSTRWRVVPGDRRNCEIEPGGDGMPGKRGLDGIALAFQRLEPWLLKRDWFPMTCMGIPSIMKRADELMAELVRYGRRDGVDAGRARALHEALATMREQLHVDRREPRRPLIAACCTAERGLRDASSAG